jgi:class 3 adenylate cyclase
MIMVSFKTKLGLGAGFLSVIISGSSLFYFYTKIRDTVWEQMGHRLEDVARTSLVFMDNRQVDYVRALDSLTRVKDIPKEKMPAKSGDFAEVLDEKTVESVQSMPEFQDLVQLLRKIKEGTKNVYPQRGLLEQIASSDKKAQLIRYAYIVVPIKEDPEMNTVKFIADADYTEFDYNQNGKIDEDEEPTTTGTLYNISEYPAMKEAFKGSITSDKEYTQDSFGVFLSAYAPVKDESGKVVAVIGLDMRADSEFNMINVVFYLYIGLVIFSVVLSISVAVILASFLTKPLKQLRLGAERVRNRDFNTTIKVTSGDEMEVLAHTFNDMVTEIRSYAENLERQNQAFYRFVPNQFLEILGKKSAIDIVMGDSNTNRMSILFCDIRSFTTISETLTPEENLQFLNGYMQIMEPAIKDRGGFVDKFVGDGIMALFVDTEYANSADNIMNAAVTMRKRLTDYNTVRISQGLPVIEMGIGISTGNVILGTIGSSSRLDTTVIGNTVNLSSRLEGLTTLYQLPVLFSGETYDLAKEKGEHKFRYVDTVVVKGQSVPTVLYELYDFNPPEIIEQKDRSQSAINAGVELYASGKFNQAIDYFQQARDICTSDPLPKIYISRCRKYLENPPESDWNGITKLMRK